MLTLAQQSAPSFAQGFARSKYEAAYPNLWDGLLGAWIPCLGVSGQTSLFDVSGRGQHGVIDTSKVVWSVGDNGTELDFDGVDDNNAPVDLPLIEYPTTKFTLSGRMKINDVAANSTLIAIADSSVPAEFADMGATTTVYRSHLRNGGNSQATGGSIATGDWVNMAAAVDVDVDENTLYVDGELITTNTTATNETTYDRCWLGAKADSTPASYLDGGVAIAAIHKRRLSHVEIRLLHDDPLALVRKKHWYPFGQAATPTGDEFPFEIYYGGGLSL